MRKALLIIAMVFFVAAISVSGCYRRIAPDVTPTVPTQTPWVITEETEVTREVTRMVEAATHTPTAMSPTPTPASVPLAEGLFQSGDRFNAIKTLWQLESRLGFENLSEEAIRLMERIKVSFERDFPQMNAGRQMEGGGWWQSELIRLVERESGCQVKLLDLVVVTEESSLINYYDLAGRSEVGSFAGVSSAALRGAPAVRVTLVCDGEEQEAYWLLLCANRFPRVPEVRTPAPVKTVTPTVRPTVTPTKERLTPTPKDTTTPGPTPSPQPATSVPTATAQPEKTPTPRPTDAPPTPTPVLATSTPVPPVVDTPAPNPTATPPQP